MNQEIVEPEWNEDREIYEERPAPTLPGFWAHEIRESWPVLDIGVVEDAGGYHPNFITIFAEERLAIPSSLESNVHCHGGHSPSSEVSGVRKMDDNAQSVEGLPVGRLTPEGEAWLYALEEEERLTQQDRETARRLSKSFILRCSADTAD